MLSTIISLIIISAFLFLSISILKNSSWTNKALTQLICAILFFIFGLVEFLQLKNYWMASADTLLALYFFFTYVKRK